MVELETILTPVSFNGGEPKRFFGLVQMLSDPTPLLGRAIAYERLIASQLIQEDEPLPNYDQNLPPPPPAQHDPEGPSQGALSAPGGQPGHPDLSAFGAGDLLQKMFDALAARRRQYRRSAALRRLIVRESDLKARAYAAARLAILGLRLRDPG